MAVTPQPLSVPSSVREPAPQQPPATRTVSGPVRLGRKTKVMVKHLLPGDIAVIDHLDIDRVSAEELIAAGASAVLNCRASTSGSYPNLGPQLLVEAGVLLIDLPDDTLFQRLSDGDPIAVLAGAQGEGDVLHKGRVVARGEVLDLARVRAETEARRREVGEALERFRAQHHRAHARGARAAGGQDRDAALYDGLRDRPALVVVRGSRSPARPPCPASFHS